MLALVMPAPLLAAAKLYIPPAPEPEMPEGPPPAIDSIVPSQPEGAVPATVIPAPMVDDMVDDFVLPQNKPVPTAQNPGQPKPGEPAYFPQLPPASACLKKDIVGLWRLTRVYETPVHSETQTFAAQPYQYMFFDWEDTYRQLKNSTAVDEKALVEQFRTAGGDLQQYVVNETGFVYFYTNSVATETMACFIVANQTNEFTLGDMLLMPPAGQSAVRMVKVYERAARLPVASSAKYQIPQEVRDEIKRKRQEQKRRKQRYIDVPEETTAPEE